MGNIEDDMIEEFSFSDLLKHVEFLDSRTPIEIICGTKSGIRCHFMTQAADLKNALMLMLIEIPALRKSLDAARKDVEILQLQKAGETLTFEPPKWEYASTPFNPILNYISHFNKWAGEGWELIQVDFDKEIAIFKRPK